MQRWTERLRTLGNVVTLDYEYITTGRKRPDPLPKLIQTHRDALQAARAHGDGPVVLIGKSMGSRVSCHLSLVEKAASLVCLGYPLCGGGDPAKLRDKVLREISTPILFVQGTRDSLCPLPLLDKVRAQMTAPNHLHAVEGGDHSLAVTKTQLRASGQTQRDVDAAILAAIEGFLGGHVHAAAS